MTDPGTLAHLTPETALEILRDRVAIPERAPELGRIEIVAIEIGRHPEAHLKIEDTANGGAVGLPVPAGFAKRLASGDEDARDQLERVMRAELN